MNIIAQEAHFRQRVVKYSNKKGVTEASRRYHVSRQAIYEWRARYDGTWKSLKEKSHRPHHHPNEHTAEEKEMILRRYPRYKDDMIMLWDSLRKSGYKRSYGSMLRVIKKWVKPETEKRRARKNKPYERAVYPGQKIQIDVKFVPSYCVADGRKYYQYTAVDECTRFCFREMYDEHSTYSSKDFLEKLFNFVQCVLCNLADIPPFLPRRHTKKLPRRRHAAHGKGSFCLIQFRVHLTEVVHRSITLRFPFFGSRNKLELCTCSSCSFYVFFRESVFCCRSSVSFV